MNLDLSRDAPSEGELPRKAAEAVSVLSLWSHRESELTSVIFHSLEWRKKMV